MGGMARKTFLRGWAAWPKQFGRDESGAMTPFTTMMFFLMLLIGGLAIDVMRHERIRVMLQQTLDNSVLAAAARSQTLDPATVVADYFDKAGMSEFLTSVTVDQGLNYRSVSADAEADTQPFFMSLMGVEEFYVNADSAAEEKISNVEISLVLDISGSMSENGRIDALRPAARNFVDTILNNSETGKASISIIPFSTQVNAGANLMAQYNVPRIQNHDSCVEFPSSSYASAALPQTLAMNHNGYFDAFTSTTSYGVSPMRFNCTYTYPSASSYVDTIAAANAILPLSGDATALKAKIDGLVVRGNTSIEIGTKWGVTLLDPETQPVTTALVGTGDVSSTFATRPLDYNPLETIKALVVMSDGDNTREFRLNSGYRTGNSNVWKYGSTLYAYHDRSGTTYDYYKLSDSKWYTTPGSATNLTWPEVFASYTVNAVAYNFFARPLNQTTTTWRTKIVEEIDNSLTGEKDVRMQQICSAAKAAGIVVYSISFEAPTGGATQLAACASGTSKFYEGDPDTIDTIFQSIATQIAFLRLTL